MCVFVKSAIFHDFFCSGGDDLNALWFSCGNLVGKSSWGVIYLANAATPFKLLGSMQAVLFIAPPA